MTESPTQFISLYSEALLLLVPLDAVAKDVFLVLCKFTDMLGFCHPGNELIGRLACHRRDQIPPALECLQAANYIHLIETQLLYRQQAVRDIQISPYMLRLRPEYQSAAVERWELYNLHETQTSKGQERDFLITYAESDQGLINLPSSDQGLITYGENDQQPEQIQNKIKNPIQNQLQNPIQSPPPAFLSHTSAYGADQPQKPPEEEKQKPAPGPLAETETQSAINTRREPASNASVVDSSAAATREPPNLLHYKSPLASLDDEQLALDLVALAPDLSRENARMLVDTYGWFNVHSTINLYRKAKSVAQPGSWLRAMMRKLDERQVRQ